MMNDEKLHLSGERSDVKPWCWKCFHCEYKHSFEFSFKTLNTLLICMTYLSYTIFYLGMNVMYVKLLCTELFGASLVQYCVQ